MDSQWLNTQFKINSGKSKAGLAKAMGLEPPAISKILNGTRQIKATEYAIMRQYFGLPVDGSSTIGGYNSAITIKTLTNANGLNDQDDSSKAEWMIPQEIISQRTDAPPHKVKIHKIEDSLMEPKFKRGNHVVVDLSDTEPSPPGTFVIFDGSNYLVRQCEYLADSNPSEIKISTLDKSFQPQMLKKEALNIIGRVIGKMDWV